METLTAYEYGYIADGVRVWKCDLTNSDRTWLERELPALYACLTPIPPPPQWEGSIVSRWRFIVSEMLTLRDVAWTVLSKRMRRRGRQYDAKKGVAPVLFVGGDDDATPRRASHLCWSSARR